MTRFPLLHETLTGEKPETRAIRQERASLIPRQVGRPANRDRLKALTIAQLQQELGR